MNYNEMINCLNVIAVNMEYEDATGITSENLRQIAMFIEDTKKELGFLECLRDAGVDNWQGYDYARELYREYYGDD